MLTKYKLKLFVRASAQMGEEREEPLRFVYTACLFEEMGEYELFYAEGEGDELSRVSLFFTEGERHALTMRREGASNTEMYFSVGLQHDSLYTVKGAGTLPIKVRAKQVENTLTPTGGHIKLAYEIEIGGVLQQNTLELTAKPIGEGEPYGYRQA